MEEKIKVWKITLEGFGHYYERNPMMIPDMLSEMNISDAYIIRCLEMDKEKYESLPEFQGFQTNNETIKTDSQFAHIKKGE